MYLCALMPVVLIAVARHAYYVAYKPPFLWLTAGHTEFVLLAVACTTVLSTVLWRLPRRQQRALVALFMVPAVLFAIERQARTDSILFRLMDWLRQMAPTG